MTSFTRGHRRESYVVSDLPELVEFRARQRTFHGAYSRTALGNLGYSLTILRLFDRRFYKIGLLFAILSGLLFLLAFIRSRHSHHDFADQLEDASSPPATDALPEPEPGQNASSNEEEGGGEDSDEGTRQGDAEEQEGVEGRPNESSEAADEPHPEWVKSHRNVFKRPRQYNNIISTAGQENTRVFGRPFITAGWIVVGVTGVVAAVEIGLLVLIFKV
ncbi:hypothetical protein BDZ89DRAFT_1073796 [Hymenopellis radicata]|nr:hypothetical protein BDZ89DRAFT_1073796 [Hymenopellis radicata]